MISSNHSNFKCELVVAVYHENLPNRDAFQCAPKIELQSSSKPTSFSSKSTEKIICEHFLTKNPQFVYNIQLNALNLDLDKLEYDPAFDILLSISYNAKTSKSVGKNLNKSVFDLTGFGLDLKISGEPNSIQDWFENHLIKFHAWSEKQIIASSTLDLSLYFNGSNDEIEREINLPMKLSQNYLQSGILPPTLYLGLKIQKTALNYDSISQNSIQLEKNIAAQKVDSLATGSNFVDQNEHEKRLFKLSFDFYRIRSMMETPANIFIKYSYNFLSAGLQKIQTETLKNLQPKFVASVPNSCCTFEFLTTLKEIISHLEKNPLELEVWTDDADFQTCISRYSLNLSQLTAAKALKFCNPDSSKEGFKKSKESSAYLCACENSANVLFDLDYALTLESFSNSNEIIKNEHETFKSSKIITQIPQNNYEARNFDALNEELMLKCTGPQSQYDFKQKIEAELRKEWADKENERQKIFHEKMSDYAKFETKMQSLLTILEKKKVEIDMKEQKVKRIQASKNIEFEKKSMQNDENLNKLKFEHKMEIKDKEYKITSLNDSKKKLQAKIKQLETANENLAKEFENYKSKNNTEVIFDYRTKVEILKSEKKMLEKELEVATDGNAKLVQKNMQLKNKIKSFSNRNKTMEFISAMNAKSDRFKSKSESKILPKNPSAIPENDENKNPEDIESRTQNIVSSTLKPSLKMDNVDYLVRELDTQIQQVLIDLEQ